MAKTQTKLTEEVHRIAMSDSYKFFLERYKQKSNEQLIMHALAMLLSEVTRSRGRLNPLTDAWLLNCWRDAT